MLLNFFFPIPILVLEQAIQSSLSQKRQFFIYCQIMLMQEIRGVRVDSARAKGGSYVEQILPVIKESEKMNLSEFSGQGLFQPPILFFLVSLFPLPPVPPKLPTTVIISRVCKWISKESCFSEIPCNQLALSISPCSPPAHSSPPPLCTMSW